MDARVAGNAQRGATRRAALWRSSALLGPVAALLAMTLWCLPAPCNGDAAEAHRQAGEEMGPQKPEEPGPPSPKQSPTPDKPPPPEKPEAPPKPEAQAKPEATTPPAAPPAGEEGAGPAPAAAAEPKEKEAAPPAPASSAAEGGEKAAPAQVPEATTLTPQEARRVKSLLRHADEDFKRWRMLEAEGTYRKVLDMDPTNAHARRRLGDCLMNQERFAEAAAAYRVLEGLPTGGPEAARYQEDAGKLAALATECAERLSAKAETPPLTDLEKAAFRDQAVRISEILRDEKDYGGSLRTIGYAEWLGRDVGAPLTGKEYNDLLVEGVNYDMERKNYAALAGLFDLADFMSIHSRERSELETKFEQYVHGEGQKIEAAARPFLSALDEEVQKRKVEDAKRARKHRPSRITQLMGAFGALAGELVGIRQAGPIIAATAYPTGPPVSAAGTGGARYSHRCTRRVDYGKIVELNPEDRATYAVAPFAFTMTPAEWQAYAGVRGYAPHQPALPAATKDGPFIIAREPVGAGGVYGYFHLDQAGDPKAQILGRYANPVDAEKALEYYLSLDPTAYSGTISHD